VTHSLRLGRASDNDLVLDDRSVSHYHARIDLVAGRASAVDLKSSNGTWVNGQRIYPLLLSRFLLLRRLNSANERCAP
jgi:pSer/pThr/pTyr-binding forkhead associated (FHA) protein